MTEVYGQGYFERGEGSNYVNYGDDPGWAVTARILSDFLPQGSAVAEVGCAKGYFVAAARVAGLAAYGCDVSRYALESAPAYLAPFLTCAPATALPWPDHHFKALCSWELLEHIPPEDLSSVLREMLRVVAPGGWFFHRIALAGPDFHSDATHVLGLTAEGWGEVFEADRLIPEPQVRLVLDDAFRDRDWFGRFFVYRKPLKLTSVNRVS